MQTSRYTPALFIALAAIGLAACSPEKPWLMEKSTLSEGQMQLVESRHVVKKPLSQMDPDTVKETARIYAKNGAGPMYVVIAYKDHGKMGDGEIVQRRAEMETSLQDAGVAARDIVMSTVPLETDVPVALIAFDTLEARGPAECEGMKMPGYDMNAEADNAYAYKTGCGVKNMIARQIEKPTDLEGRAGLGGRNDGEHLANVVATTRVGTPREFLPSYILSELASSGQ